MKTEPTRVREHGTQVTNTAEAPDPGQARIDAVKKIVDDGAYAKIDGVMVDLFSASAIMAVYNALNEQNQARMRNLRIDRMATLAFKFVK